MRYIWDTIIDEVVEKTMTICGKRDAEGNSQLILESAGWYVRMGNVSFCVGLTKPNLKKGDRIRLTLEPLLEAVSHG